MLSFKSTSELFGGLSGGFLNEESKMDPRSPYAIAKYGAFQFTQMYRESQKLFICNGILFNHESPRRGPEFVTKKICKYVVLIANGLKDELLLGNLEASRDWGHAKDYVQAMWKMLQQEKPDDYVIATGETHTIRECVELAFSLVNIPLKWEGKGVDEVGINQDTGKIIVKIDSNLFRPTEVPHLLGDAAKAKEKLGWKPTTSFKELITEMVQAEKSNLENDIMYQKVYKGQGIERQSFLYI